MLSFLKDHVGYQRGKVVSEQEVWDLVAEMTITQTFQPTMRTALVGTHPDYGPCLAVISVLGECVFMWECSAPNQQGVNDGDFSSGPGHATLLAA